MGPAALLVALARLVSVAAQPISNADVFFHLRLGEQLGWPWHWAAPIDWSPFATSSWVPTQPLSESLLAGVQAAGGLPAVAWLYGLQLIVFAMSVYAVIRSGHSSLAAGFGTAFALIGTAPSLSPRPQLLGLILLVWAVHLWLRAAQDGRPLWGLVALYWIWAMTHGYWVVGVSVACVAVAGSVISGKARQRDAARLAGLVAACVGVVALTPLGPRVVLGPLVVNERSRFITEWQRTDWTQTHTWVVAAMVVVPLLLAAVRRDWVVTALLVLAAGWLAYSERTSDVAAVIAAPFAAAAIDALRHSGHGTPRRLERRVLAGAVAAALVTLAAVVPHTASTESATTFPLAFTEELDALAPGTVVFCEPATGSWLSWRVPQLSRTVDGMFDAYEVDYLLRSLHAVHGRAGAARTVARSGAAYAITERQSPLSHRLRQAGWTELDTDAGYVLMRRTDSSSTEASGS